MKRRGLALLISVVPVSLLLALGLSGAVLTTAQSQPTSTVLIASASDGMSRNQQEQIPTETSIPHSHLPSASLPPYLEDLMRATYDSISATVVLSTGLPYDKCDVSLLDIIPQLACVHETPYTQAASGASLKVSRCTSPHCVYSGYYGLKFEYHVPPPAKWGSYRVDSHGFDVSQAIYLEAWVKGAQGGEKFEFVLWDDPEWPDRPNSAEISVSQTWELRRIPLADFQPYVDLSKLRRLSIGFNDRMHAGGTVYIDQIAFVGADGKRIYMPPDEVTTVSNIGLYIASVIGALERGWEDDNDVVAELSKTLTSIEAFQKWHGFPQTHNHGVSLKPASHDQCISFVDTGNLVAGLILLRQRIPELRDPVNAILNPMEWDWFYDSDVGLPYGCRFPDDSASDWHFDWLAADSHLAHFICLGTEGCPPESWCNLNRSLEPNKCASLPYDVWHFEPGWDSGGLFMQFLPGIFMKEMEKPLGEMGISACNFAQDQICYAWQIDAQGWGWSATALPPYGAEYCGWGCERDDILMPHASILAVDCIGSTELVTNLLALEDLGARPPVWDGDQTFDYGFVASVNWQTREVATVYLVLDQSMAFLSLVNHSTNGRIRDVFYQDEIAQKAITLIPGCSGVSLSPGYSQSDKPGTVVSYAHILVNTGNHTDTIFLDMTSSLSWPVTATIMPPMQRDARMTTTVIMSLTIPVSATICTVENTVITATSQTDATVFDTATDITTVGTCIFLPLVLKELVGEPL